MSSEPTLLCDRADGVATVTLNRPHVLNALDAAQRTWLTAVFEELDRDPQVRAVVLAGRGRSFCAGQDQKESASFDAAGARSRIDAYAALYAAMRALGKPLIARLHGHVAGAGLQLALLCDLRIAAEDTKLGMTEFSIGSAAILGSALLRPIVGEAMMKRLVMMSDFVPAATALACQLVTEIHPPDALDARVADIAALLATRAPLGVRLTKSWWRAMSEAEFQTAVRQAHQAHAENFAAGGLSHGAQAFVRGERGG